MPLDLADLAAASARAKVLAMLLRSTARSLTSSTLLSLVDAVEIFPQTLHLALARFKITLDTGRLLFGTLELAGSVLNLGVDGVQLGLLLNRKEIVRDA